MTEFFLAQSSYRRIRLESQNSLIHVASAVSEAYYRTSPPLTPDPFLFRARYWPHVRFLTWEKIQEKSGNGGDIISQILLSQSEVSGFLQTASENVAKQVPNNIQADQWHTLMGIVRDNLVYKCDPLNLYRNTVITWLTGPSDKLLKEEFKTI